MHLPTKQILQIIKIQQTYWRQLDQLQQHNEYLLYHPPQTCPHTESPKSSEGARWILNPTDEVGPLANRKQDQQEVEQQFFPFHEHLIDWCVISPHKWQASPKNILFLLSRQWHCRLPQAKHKTQNTTCMVPAGTILKWSPSMEKNFWQYEYKIPGIWYDTMYLGVL